MKDPMLSLPGSWKCSFFKTWAQHYPWHFPAIVCLFPGVTTQWCCNYECVCVHKLDNNSGTSTPRAPQTLAQWKQSAWERRDGDNYESERGEQREIRVYVRRNSWIMCELSVYLKMSRQSRPWVEGKYPSQEGPPVFPKPIALFWLVEDWKQPLELCVDLVTW